MEVGGKNAHFINITVGHGVIAAGYLYFKPNGSRIDLPSLLCLRLGRHGCVSGLAEGERP